MNRWTPLLLGSELFLVLFAGWLVDASPLLLFPGTLFIYFMTGGLLFYSLIFDEITKRKMFRKQSRRWALLALLVGFNIPSWLLLSFLFLFAFRGILISLLMLFKKRGWTVRRLAIIGSMEVTKSLDEIFWSGYLVVVHIPKPFDSLVTQLETLKIEELWIALPLKEQSEALPILKALAQSTIDIKLIPDLSEVAPLNFGISQIGRLAAIHVQETPMQGINRLIKSFEDKLLAAMILIMMSPLMLLTALLVKLSSSGPVFYRQERVSWNNECFWMLKFRTMSLLAEATTGPVWARAHDSRTTEIGKWLRKSCIDELPQFFNVLRGEMSIVGPRPERPHFIQQFKNEIPSYMQKHMVKAGITGLAQIRGFRGQSDLNRRIEYDLQYIREWSLWLDLKIIVLTLFKGFKNAY